LRQNIFPEFDPKIILSIFFTNNIVLLAGGLENKDISVKVREPGNGKEEPIRT